MSQRKSFISGMATMLMLVILLIPIASYSANSSINVTLSDIKVYVDNKLLDLKDDNGNILQPIIYNGRTYLPVKAISQAVNKPLTWEAKTKSVYVGKHDLDIPAAYLTDLKSFYSDGNLKNLSSSMSYDNLGNSYDSSKTLTANSDSYNVYNIDGKYSTLKGKCFIVNEEKNTKYRHYAKIYGDDVLLWSGTFTAGVFPMDFSIDITGYNQLKIEIEQGFWSDVTLSFADLALYP